MWVQKVSFIFLGLLVHAFTASESSKKCDLFIAESRFLENGVGIFAGEKLDNRSTQPPAITLSINPLEDWQIRKYMYSAYQRKESEHYSLIEFGPAMIFNHHQDQANIDHRFYEVWGIDKVYMETVVFPQIKTFQLLQANTIYPMNIVSILNDIDAGDELLFDYGSYWFYNNDIELKIPTKQQTSYESIEALKKVGHCISNIHTAPSLIKSDESTGQGVFASVGFEKGEFVDISPVLIHPKHEVLESSDETSVLINFCFSRPGSDVSLLPIGYAAVCNHGGKKLANVAIEWYFWGGNYNGSALERDPEYMINSHFAELYFGYRALRDITKDEEILLDYGDDWEADWKQYLQRKKEFALFQEPIPLFRRAIDLPAYMFSNKWYSDCIGTSCASVTKKLQKTNRDKFEEL